MIYKIGNKEKVIETSQRIRKVGEKKGTSYRSSCSPDQIPDALDAPVQALMRGNVEVLRYRLRVVNGMPLKPLKATNV